MVTVPKIVAAVERSVELAGPVWVVAFGSRARGDHKVRSDLDLAVIVERYDRAVYKRPVWRAEIDVWMDLDLLVYDVERDRLMRDSLVSLQGEVYREGVTLYDREKGYIDEVAAARLV